MPTTLDPNLVRLAERLTDAVAVMSTVRDDAGAVIDFRFEYVNDAALVMTGLPRDEFESATLLELFPMHRSLGLFDRYREVAERHGEAEIDVPWFAGRTVAGSFHASVASVPGGIVLVARDVTSVPAEERVTPRFEPGIDVLMAHVGEAVFHVVGSCIRWVSPGVTELLGWDPTDLIGRPTDFLLDEDERGVLARIRSQRHSETRETYRLRMRTADGEGRWTDNSVRPILSGDEDATREYVVVARDATADVEAKEALARAEARLAKILNTLSNPVVVLDRLGIVHAVSGSIDQFGFGETEIIGKHLTTLLADASRGTLAAALAEIVAAPVTRPCRAPRVLADVAAKDGRTVPVAITLTNLLDDRDVDGVIAVIRDRTDELEAAALFAAVFERAPGGMTLWGVEPDMPRIVMANAAYTQITGRTAEDFESIDVRAITDEEQYEALREGRRRLIAGETDHDQMDLRQLHADGHWIWVSMKRSTVRGADGRPRYLIAQVEDITARKLAEDRALSRALTDELTGLANRRGFGEALRDAMERGRASDTPVAIAYVDVDHFKTVNDNLGHLAGDAVLREVAQLLGRCVRPGDIVARVGGDEFAVVFERIGPAEMLGVARRMSDIVHVSRVMRDGRHHRVTVSIGVALADRRAAGEEPLALVDRADRAMYRAKQAGGATWAVDDGS